MTSLPRSRAGSPEDPADLEAFLTHHDALLQNRVAVLAHAYGAVPHDVFLRLRATLWSSWSELGARDDQDRIASTSLLLVRAAGDRDAGPPASAAPAAVRSLRPAWRHPDPWALLAPRDMRALRALVHLDTHARDLVVLQWLGVDGEVAARELGLAPAEHRRRREHALATWRHVVRAGT